jgi:ATP-dependent Zn protease
VTWNWDSSQWKKSTRLLLGVATIWPIIYMGLFFVVVFGGIFLGAMFAEPAGRNTTRLDLIQLEKKIQAGEISRLRLTGSTIEATDHNGRAFETNVDNESTREEIIRQARQTDANGQPRVQNVEEKRLEPSVNPIFPVGFFAFFAVHMITMFLLFALMPLYIILAIKNERLDQTMRIVWVVLACTVGMVADPIYWYLYVWRKPSGDNLTPGTAA